MIDVEFGVDDTVTYRNSEGKDYSAKVHNAVLNPVTGNVEYHLMYRTRAAMCGYMRVVADPNQIRESKYFKE